MAGYLKAPRDGRAEPRPTPISGAPAVQKCLLAPPLTGVSTPASNNERLRAVQGAPATVLVVDDEPVLLRTTRRLLEQRGFAVVCVESADAAMDVLAGGRAVDLLMTDVSLRRANGLDLVRRARSLRPALRVLYVSGFDRESVGLEAFDRQDSFLAKPYTPRELDDRLRDLLLPEASS